ncbi:gfo/Idh/MocA family oxidoreductase [Cohnella sp. 56]|uniref:gfo/Idh/MocA family oxidoreductase n=1 Tax=Cohnella sp. 56 TaxID=3113722 RepID=UPI0030EA17EB
MTIRTIGLIGTDSSHATVFTELLNDPEHRLHVPGFRVTAAWPGGSPDFPLSASRVDAIMGRLEAERGVARLDSPEQVAASCDALMLLSIDGRERVRLFERIAPYGKPVFIDKPLALGERDAAALIGAAELHRTPIFSASALRYAIGRRGAASGPLPARERIARADVRGPLQVEPTQSIYYWYGIHLAEMLFELLGSECESVRAERRGDHDLLIGQWTGGRVGTAYCDCSGDYRFEAACSTAEGNRHAIAIEPDMTISYARLVADIASFFATGIAPVPAGETRAAIRFLEAAELSLSSGQVSVPLNVVL